MRDKKITIEVNIDSPENDDTLIEFFTSGIEHLLSSNTGVEIEDADIPTVSVKEEK